MSLKNRLNRLKPHLVTGINQSSREVTKKEESKNNTNIEIPYQELWMKENVTPYYFDDRYCLVRRVTYPLTHQHGNYYFHQVIEAVNLWNKKGGNHPLSSNGLNPGDLFFFDTETTGLGGGAGNTIFLLGHAVVNDESVTLTQHLLPNPGAEVALYQSFLETIDYTTLVTYNGKAFDWPQVKTRHTLVRDHVPKLPSFGHFDLYHAARRMWKHKIERMKLTVVEKEILGFERKDDIPGFLAPMIYFDFLERKHPEGILGVMKHNELDILSLISLYSHLSFQILGVDRYRTAKETYEVGKWYAYLGERDKAKENFEDIANGSELEAIQAKHALAFEHKRNKEWDKAVELWKTAAELGMSTIQIEACVELAKIYEHQKKNIPLAMEYTKKAKSILQSLNIEKSKKYFRLTEELTSRITRLNKKLKVK